ncbi:hypothetical protein Zmor_012871 [Zophobas morio]|uniref:CHK kinase-like domain-containing protein n=1 Tax=Zophobas morio TaxID=2755281 RepID=A0AA38MEQ8_9CUCU|nr:hypothetical protein Zmor_012871 [Zophobas morio]
MGDLHFTLKDCDDVVKQCLQTTEVRTTDFEIIPRHNDNFIFKITIDRPDKQTLYFYAKSKCSRPRNVAIFDGFKGFDAKIAPKFVCGKSDLLFFEDLTCQRFQTNLGLFDLRHVRGVLGVLAEFHGAGLAFDRTGTKKLQEYGLETSNFHVDEVGDLVWGLVDNKEVVDEVRKNLDDRQESKFAKTLCHGNLTWRNILFHYANGVPDGCKLVNFGGKLYAPPAYDVLQAIFFNTNENFRQCELQNLVIYYHKKLDEALKKYDLTIEELLPLEQFQLSIQDVLPLIKIENVTLNKKDGDDSARLALKEALEFSRLTREDCYVVVKNAINSYDYDLQSFHLNHERLTIKIRHNLDDKIINCIVKTKSKDDSFKKELFIYGTFVPKLHQLNISLINDCLPQCYHHKPEDLVLEDLQDFVCQSEPFDFQLLSIVVKKLAQFHACSFLIEEEMSKKLKTTYRLTSDYDDALKDSFFVSNLNLVKDSLHLFPHKEDNLTKLLPNLVENFAKPSDRFRNVVSIGVLSSSKIQIRSDNVDCRFVDFQTATYCPPAFDFLSLLYLTTQNNENELKKIYHDELGKIAAAHNHNLEKFFSYHEFVDSVEFYRPQVIMQALIYNSNKEQQLSENPTSRLKLQQLVVDLYEVCNKLPNV